MERLFHLLGQAIPDTATGLGVKVLCVGLGATAAGLALGGSGIAGMALPGVGVAACGFAASALAIRVLIREGRRKQAARLEEQIRRETEAMQAMEQRRREKACKGHEWSFDDYGLNINAWRWICGKCGAVTEENPLR